MNPARPLSVLGAVLCLMFFTATGAVQAQTCEPRERLHALAVSAEAYGEHDLVVEAAPGLRLVLFRAQWGWRIAVLDEFDKDVIPNTPIRGLADPRELYGWHFRNAANTGPNLGDVNAPQQERRFVFMRPGDRDTASGIGCLRRRLSLTAGSRRAKAQSVQRPLLVVDRLQSQRRRARSLWTCRIEAPKSSAAFDRCPM